MQKSYQTPIAMIKILRVLVACLMATLFEFFLLTPSLASHVVGGNLEMVNVDNVPGRYKIVLNMYFDEINQNVGGVPDAEALIYVYRKSDNKRITSLYIPALSRQSINYTNRACATLRQIKTTLYRYEGTVNWNPDNYNDPGGYYMTWQYCCRNGDIDNIRDPLRAGETFYLEFPALSQNGKAVYNSSPVFGQVDGEYLCINEPFRFSFAAKDSDGDELRYSMDTPYDRLDPEVGVGSKNGLNVQWRPNFNAEKAIPGNPPLTINRQTGELSVTANQVGLFVFTVVVEEYRNGQKIGLVRRDYQLFVVDCPPTTPPDPTVTINNLPTTEIQVCEGKPAELKATANANWDYQWKKDGKSIVGATNAALSVTETGTYQLTTSLKAQCSKTRRSDDVKVTVTKSRFKLKSEDPFRLCGTLGSVRLDALSGTNMIYQWYLNGKLLSDNTVTLVARQPGQYWAVVRDYSQGCTSFSDTVQITNVSPPIALITPQQSTTVICNSDSLLLTTPIQVGYKYQWSFNNISIGGATNNTIVARQAGFYKISVIDSNSCTAQSLPFSLTVTPTIKVMMNPVPSFCGTDHPPIKLQGYPIGGIFDGPGVHNGFYDPKLAGIGIHTLRYSVNSVLACQSGEAFEKGVVIDPPSIDLGPDTEVWRGGSVQLKGGIGSDYTYLWTPQTGLSSSTISDPQATPEKTTSYTLTATDSNGCSALDNITVNVYERIWIPDAFSPNGDGVNDSWELRGIESYPQAEVTIFNRWGEVIFFSKQYNQPFDGQFNNSPLATGVYVYQIKPSPTQTVLRGSLMLLK